MELVESNEVAKIIESYPDTVRDKLTQLRQLIIEIAKSTDGIDKLLETTKWGEPSYVTKIGSTIRMDWKPKTPDHYYLYFICTTELVNTFKFIFGNELQFNGNRAIVIELNQPLPTTSIKKCLELAMTYHKVKHLPMLGA